MKTSRNLFVVEGPDGAGKSTLVREIVRATGANPVHLGPFKHVSEGLERLYTEAMLPAIEGHADVVMDRCWLSEKPYGTVFRNGLDRLGVAAVRSLERLALRARTVVIRALPPIEVAAMNFARRKGVRPESEMLNDTEQFAQVYDLYATKFRTSLPVIDYDYTGVTASEIIGRSIVESTSNPHPLEWATAGSLIAPIALIGDSLAEHHNRDMLYRWPFSSFGGGPAKWLGCRLERGEIPEDKLFWTNADVMTPEIISWMKSREMKIIALGSTAASVLVNSGAPPDYTVSHPNACSKFKPGSPEDYELIPILRRLLTQEGIPT